MMFSHFKCFPPAKGLTGPTLKSRIMAVMRIFRGAHISAALSPGRVYILWWRLMIIDIRYVTFGMSLYWRRQY